VKAAEIAALGDADARVRNAAAAVLAGMGPDARDAVPALERMRSSDPDESVRFMADQALRRILEVHQ